MYMINNYLYIQFDICYDIVLSLICSNKQGIT